MVFTETHLDSTITDSELFPSNYTVFRRDGPHNGRKGGSVLIATNAPWINYNLIKLCRKKKLLYKRAKKSCKESDWVNYHKFNNHLKKECNSARWRYINNLTEELKSNTSPKPFWNHVKSK